MFYFAGIVISLFLFLLLITKQKKKKSDYVLCSWLALCALNLTTYYLLFSAQYTSYPSTVVFGFTLPLLQGPFLYLYIQEHVNKKRWFLRTGACFLPFLFSNILFLDYYFLPFEERVAVIENNGQGFETEVRLNLLNIYISGVLFILLSVRSFIRYRSKMLKQHHSLRGTPVNWLAMMILWMAIIWTIVLSYRDETLIYAAVTAFIIWLGYSGIKQTEIFSSPEKTTLQQSSDPANELPSKQDPEDADEAISISSDATNIKYQKSTLTDEKAAEIHEKLKKILQEDQLYKNPDLNLSMLATLLEIHPNRLSQVINDKEQKSFHELINEMRVEEFIRLASHAKYSHFTLLAIAFDCGFNSKAAFNRNFKKYTGVTPRAFMKQIIC